MSKTSDELKEALLQAEEVFERCLCPFFLLGDTARQIVDANDASLSGNSIELGIKSGELSDFVLSTLKEFVPGAIFTDHDISMVLRGVPVHVTIVRGKWSFLDAFDSKFFFISQYFVPNPFEEYWKKREAVV